MKEIMKKAHKMTRGMVEKYGVDYQAQLGLCLAYLLENKEEERMVELKGTEKQVALAKKRLEKMEQNVEQHVAEWQERINLRPNSKSAEIRKQQIHNLRKGFKDFKANERSSSAIIHLSGFDIIAALKEKGYYTDITK